jgi:hypothetical protein
MKTTLLDGDLIVVNEVAATCRICGCGMMLQLAVGYPAGKDPQKLIPMATCNRCYDLRERRIKIESSFKRLCHALAMEKMDESKRDRTHELLKVTCSAFGRWCSDLLRRQHTANVGFLANAITEQPDRWYHHLKDFETAANNP